MTWDCIVVGGGAAGLSAALVLGRARRSTLLIDAGEQSNRHAHGIGGLLGHDGRPPGELYAGGREELAAYPSVEVRAGAVVGGERVDDELRARAGRRGPRAGPAGAAGDRHGVPAARAAGRGRAVGPGRVPLPVLSRLGGPRPAAGRAGRRRRAACTGRCCCATGARTSCCSPTERADIEAADRDRLAAAGITVDERPVERAGRARRGARRRSSSPTATGSSGSGLLVPAPLHQRSDLAEQLGAAAGEAGPVVVDPVGIDAKYATSAAGRVRRRRSQHADAADRRRDRRRLDGRRDGRPDPGLRRARGVVPAGAAAYRRSASVVITAS